MLHDENKILKHIDRKGQFLLRKLQVKICIPS